MKKTVKELIFILIAIASIILVVQIHQYLASIKYKAEECKLHPHANPLWYYTLQEVEDYYKIHYNRKERLPHYVYYKAGRYIGSVESYDDVATFKVPNNFIQSMLSHLQQGLEKGWFKFIFWADLNHGHPFLSIKAKEEHLAKYGAGVDGGAEYISHLLLRKDLGILYHAAEHFDPRDPANNKYNQTRNIIGWFDGEKQIGLAYPDSSEDSDRRRANTVSNPKGYETCGFINVSAHHDGAFSIIVNDEIIRLDISFCVKDVYDGIKYKHKLSHLYPPDGIIIDLGIF